ncbi:NAD(P)-binding protein [Loigolactobacillus rennini]|nr:NAD(P)-binding protein [Loigolactobacillus rennini]
MSRLTLDVPEAAEETAAALYKSVQMRMATAPTGLCPVEVASAYAKLCHSQSCGKCAPCRIGLGQLANLLDQVRQGEATDDTLDLIESSARSIKNSSDCAIGFQAAAEVLRSLVAFRPDFKSHIHQGYCQAPHQGIPCVRACPAHVDIPGYISLIAHDRSDEAVQLIRKDNPFPTACAFICEHPCENLCRRNIIDSSLNIRGLKAYCVDHEKHNLLPMAKLPATGKKVAIIGGGPSGLSAAFYLQLMGHQVTVYDQRKHLGGMLRYGIPSYRLNRKDLQRDIDVIADTGVEIHKDHPIADLAAFQQLRADNDAVYIAIGAHTDKKLRIPGEDARGVMSAVDMLRGIGDYHMPDFKGKKVVVVGGGNVAMDVVRSSVRLGAEQVTLAYRRRQADMTALPDEIAGAIAENVVIAELMSPIKVETDQTDQAKALWVQPQVIGPYRKGRPSPRPADTAPVRLEADIVVVAIGQNIDSDMFKQAGLPVEWGELQAGATTHFEDQPDVFSGGDCATGPSTAIKAIAAGKVAAANIDQYLGFDHKVKTDIDIPEPMLHDRMPCGRVEIKERIPAERSQDFDDMALPMSDEEAKQEASRCLRCDHFGYGSFRGGRENQW